MDGRVLFFHKTFGFIRSDELKEDIYFNYEDIISNSEYKEAFSGDYCTFELDNNKKTKAVNVRIKDCQKDGKKILKVMIFKISNNSFKLNDFYKKVISKMSEGLKYSKIYNDYIIITSFKINDNIACNIINHEAVEGYEIKIIK